MSDFTRFTMSCPEWWLAEVKKVADEQGVSVSALVRMTVTQAWNLTPDDEDEDGDDEDG